MNYEGYNYLEIHSSAYGIRTRPIKDDEDIHVTTVSGGLHNMSLRRTSNGADEARESQRQAVVLFLNPNFAFPNDWLSQCFEHADVPLKTR